MCYYGVKSELGSKQEKNKNTRHFIRKFLFFKSLYKELIISYICCTFARENVCFSFVFNNFATQSARRELIQQLIKLHRESKFHRMKPAESEHLRRVTFPVSGLYLFVSFSVFPSIEASTMCANHLAKQCFLLNGKHLIKFCE